MNRERLFELAFRYKKTKLWEKLWDDQVFGVEMSDGTIAYVCAMGRMGDYNALAVYVGEEGALGYRKALSQDIRTLGLFDRHEAMTVQNCLQVTFGMKDELEDEEIEEARMYGKKFGYRFGGANSYPTFIKFEPAKYPWKVLSEKDMDYLAQAIEASLILMPYLKGKNPEAEGFVMVKEEEITIPLLRCVDGEWKIDGTTIFPVVEENYVAPTVLDEIALQKLKKKPVQGKWECALSMFPEPIAPEDDGAPEFPYMLMAVEEESHYALKPLMAKDYKSHPEDLVNGMVDCFNEEGMKPAGFIVKDDRTQVMLELLASKLGVSIEKKEELPAVEECQEGMLAYLEELHGEGPDGDYDDEDADREFVFGVIEAILEMTPEELEELPQELIEQLHILVLQGALPEEYEMGLSEIFGF